jgi:hypothetical protein
LHKVAANVKALLSGVALATVQLSKDKLMPCSSSSYIIALQLHLQQCTSGGMLAAPGLFIRAAHLSLMAI